MPFDVAGKTGITGFPNEQERMINHFFSLHMLLPKIHRLPFLSLFLVVIQKNIALITSEILESWNTLQKENKQRGRFIKMNLPLLPYMNLYL